MMKSPCPMQDFPHHPAPALANQANRYPWERHWTPFGASADHRRHQDLLYQPTANTDVKSTDLLSRSSLLVLLGGLGMGKSRELEGLHESLQATGGEFRSRLVRASELGADPGDAISRLRAWRHHEANGGAFTLLVDGIDEVLPYHPGFISALALFLEENPSPTLQVVLGMRTGAWNGATLKKAFEKWHTTEEQSVHEICPLTREDIRITFQHRNEDGADDFLEWIHQMHVVPMARIPLYLQDVIDNWREEPTKPRTIHELRDRQIERLLAENPDRSHSPGMPEPVPIPKLLALAEMIAVHSILSGRPRLSIRAGLPDEDDLLDLNEFQRSPLASSWKMDGAPIPFTITDLSTLIGRALFRSVAAPGAPQVFSFDHHSFAEHLAGRCLRRQPLEQVIRILGNSAGSRIVPQMEALAALLAPANPALADWLLERQPTVLLRSDASQFLPARRAQIVESVLDHLEASDEKAWLSWSEVDTGYACPEASEILIGIIQNRSLKVLTRLAALAIAERCPAIEMAETLWATSNDTSEDEAARREATDGWLAFARLDIPGNLDGLWKIGKGEAGHGTSDARSNALQVLLKGGIPAREILKHLPPAEEHYIGRLELLRNFYLPPSITIEDIPAVLEHLNRGEIDSFRGIREDAIAKGTYKLVFENLHSTEILSALADHWWIMEKNHHIHLGEELHPILDTLPPPIRHSLLLALLLSPEKPEEHFAWSLPVKSEDFEWIVDQYLRANGLHRALWGPIVKGSWYAATADGVPDWLERAHTTGGDEFKNLFPKQHPRRSFSETITRFHQTVALCTKRKSLQGERRRIRKKSISREDFNKRLESEFHSNPASGWARFANHAFKNFVGEERKPLGRTHWIEESPGWLSLTEESRNAARSAARLFLEEENESLDKSTWTNWHEAAYQAIDLLHDEIQGDHKLAEVVVAKWINSVIRHSNNGEERHQQLVHLIAGIAPDRVRKLMIEEAEEEITTTEYCMSLRQYAAAWHRDDSLALSAMLESHLCGSRRQEQLRQQRSPLPESEEESKNGYFFAFNFLVKADPDQARNLVLKLGHAPLETGGEPHATLPLLIASGLIHFPDLWQNLWSVLQSYSPETASRTFDLLLPRLDRGYFKEGWTKDLNARQLSDLYIFFDNLHPNPPPRHLHSDHETGVSHRYAFERSIYGRITDAGQFQELERLIAVLKSEDRRDTLRFYLKDARQNADRASWSTPTVNEISRWLVTEDAVLVRSNDDLLEAVRTSLARYQEKLSLDGRFVLDCWRRQGSSTNNEFRPIGEEDLSARIDWHLKEDLMRIIISRESEIRVSVSRKRTDITVSTVVDDRTLTVIIEHKRAHNTGVETEMKNQLAERYLDNSGVSHGLYLVSWFDGFAQADGTVKAVKNELGVASSKEALEVLSTQAALLSTDGRNIKAFVLDCVNPGGR